jgi:hypothetical protein
MSFAADCDMDAGRHNTVSSKKKRRTTDPRMDTAPTLSCAADLDALVLELRQLQRTRQFCITSQSRCNRSCEAFIARYLGFDVNAEEDARKAVFKRAQALRESVERGDGENQHPRGDDQVVHVLSVVTPIVLANKAARATWDALRTDVEDKMRDLARSLPVWAWVKQVRGFGELGLAVVIGETGNLSNYATQARVWKRLGLAVIDGARQGNPGTNASKEAWIAHGYSPKRRAEMWAFFSDAMFRHQWRGPKRDPKTKEVLLDEHGQPVEAAHAIGPYGAVYGRRREITAEREGWTDARRQADARRIMTKAVIADLWRQWRALDAHDA